MQRPDDMTNAPTLPDFDKTEQNASYWVNGGRNEPKRGEAVMAVEQAVNAWKNCAYATRNVATTLRDQLAEAQREIERLKARCIELELDIIDAQTVRDNSLKILGQQVERAETAEQQLAAETARADANEKDARILDWLEDESKCYWVEVQSQPTGDVVYAGSGKALREAITAALAQS